MYVIFCHGMFLVLIKPIVYIVKFSLPRPSETLIVLSQLDSRYYRDVAGRAAWTMDFTLVKEGEKIPLAESAHSEFFLRSVHLEIELEAGDYIVYVRLDRTLDRNEVCLISFLYRLRAKENFQDNNTISEWQLRKMSRIMTERAKSQSIASSKPSYVQLMSHAN
jgi:hypothetical protein